MDAFASPVRRTVAFAATFLALSLPSLALAQSGYTSDLAVSAQGPRDADRGKAFTYTVNVYNAGPAAAQDVVVQMPLFSGLSFAKASSDAACREEGATVVCSIPAIQPSATRSLSVSFLTAYQDSCVFREYDIQFSVSAFQYDPNAVNDVSLPLHTAIRCVARPTECSDGADNDADGFIDQQDPGCTLSFGDNERQDQFPAVQRRMRTTPPASRASSSSSSLRSVSSRSSSRPVAQNVRVNVDAPGTAAQPGESLPVRIVVHNPSDTPKMGLTVRFSYDPSQITVAGQGNGRDNGSSYAWTFDLLPRQTRVLSLTATVSPSVQPGTTIVASARVEGVSGSPISSLVLPVALTMPETGASPFTGVLESSFLSPLSRGGSLLLLLVLVPAGLIAGGAGMRKAQKERA